MSVKIKELLEQTLEKQIELANEASGDERYARIEETVKLVDRYNEMNRIDLDHDDKLQSREMEKDFKREEMRESKRDRQWKNGVAIGTFIGSTVVFIGMNLFSMRFEQEFVQSTEAGKNSTRKLLGMLDKYFK